MNNIIKLHGDERRDFLSSKFAYYRRINTYSVILACLTSCTYFVSDCQLFGRFAKETIIPRFSILIAMIIFMLINSKVNDYRIISILSHIIAHEIMWCTIWAIYYLPVKTHASEGFIIMHLIFIAIAFSAPFAYTTISHILLIVDILVSNIFNHYENLDIMLSLGIPCLIAITAYNYVLSSSYYDNYIIRKQMEKSLVIDPLTNVYNRNILKAMTKENKFTFVRAESISVIMVDIDFFKKVNDTYGHSKGDIVLKSVTTVIQSCTRGGDYTIRWGGEEFIVIMPNCTPNEASMVAERIRKKIEVSDTSVCPITVSIGVAGYDNTNYKNSINQADRALYVAKQTGRNKVVCYKKGTTTDILTQTI